MGRSHELLARIGEALGGLLRHRAAPAGGDGGGGGAGDGDPEPPGTLEQSVAAVGQALDRWRNAAELARFLSRAGRDHVVGVGETVVLGARLDAPLRWVAERVRFFVNGQPVGEAELGGAEAAGLPFRAEAAGCHLVEYELIGPAGVVLGGRDRQRATRLEVVADAPVAAIDARLLVGDPAAPQREAAPQPWVLTALRRLAARGVVCCWVDFVDEDRTPAIRAALAAHGLRDGAILAHPRSALEFDPLGVDVRAMVRTTTLRRLRAAGVPLCLLGWSDPATAALPPGEEVTGVGPQSLAALAGDEEAIDDLRARAARFAAARDGASSRMSFRLDQATRTIALDGNSCRVELDNRAAREAILGAVERARRSVHLQFYIVRPGLFTEHLAVRLIERARAGVRVRLLVDALYSGEQVMGMQNPVLRGLSDEPNIEVAAADPIDRYEHVDRVRLKQREHRKLITVDGELAFVSGRNAGDEYYTGFDEVPVHDATPHERIPWLDAHVEVRGPIVAEIERAFAAAWARGRGRPLALDELAAGPAAAPAGSSRARLVLHEGVSDASGMVAYEAIIDAARSHLYLVNDFPVTLAIADALRRARSRGVRVTLLTGSALTRRGDGTFLKGPLYRELFEYMSKRRFEPLVRAGVDVREFSPPPSRLVVCRGGRVRPYVHAKVITADGEVASIGSANLDVTASYWEREANLVIEDPAVVAALEARLQAMVDDGYRIELASEYWRREAAQREIVDRLWPEIVYS